MYKKDWVDYFTDEFGIGKITVANSTHMHWEFIQNKEEEGHGSVTDDVWIVKKDFSTDANPEILLSSQKYMRGGYVD